jgi:hypothetical protein
MRWHGRRVSVYAYTEPTDMRKGFDGLSALVSERLSARPQSWLELIPTRIYFTPSMRLSPVLAPSRIRKIS